ncbi:diphthine methyl ester synthase-like [Ctenocephalides felis]|uniref:diphthine methyl ester synthase-like n=1 Tax=Ctenocephalides felis TaxID=7515 RepID=UPI000E6E3A38|nr:diphthine methyl ester synthase-like [Ctenocephalides felis]
MLYNLTQSLSNLEKFYGKKIILADRENVEQGSDDIMQGSDKEDVAFLVVGDPFGATTHTDIVLRAKEKGYKCQVIHNASILNAVGCCGLQLYNFGETVSIPYWNDDWKPDSFYDKIKGNRLRGLHTLCLLDIKVKEPTLESLTKKKREYEPPRFMKTSEAADQLLQIVEKLRSNGIPDADLAYFEDTTCVGLARIGSETQAIIMCSLSTMRKTDMGPPLHSLIIPAEILHPVEQEYLDQFKLKQ